MHVPAFQKAQIETLHMVNGSHDIPGCEIAHKSRRRHLGTESQMAAGPHTTLLTAPVREIKKSEYVCCARGGLTAVTSVTRVTWSPGDRRRS